jgi:Uma2 family endonuclease
MASAPSPVSLEEYMRTSYSPDCEYIDGIIVERNVGKGKHSYTQAKLNRRLDEVLGGRGLITLVEQRTRVAPGRVRIPDVSVVSELEEVTLKPPFLCVEVVSPEDRWSRINASISDYQAMEVPCVWVVDPYGRSAWIFDLEQPPAAIGEGGMLRAEVLEVEIQLSDVLPPVDL